jgi:capsid protein
MSWGRRIEEEELPWIWPDSPAAEEPEPVPIQAQSQFISPPTGTYDGANFWGGVSGQIDEIASLDYWTLRARSGALFRTNTYAIGIVNRLVTNVIHKGLEPEFTPEESVIGAPKDSLVDWANKMENRYRLYGKAKDIIDCKGYRIDGEQQAQIYQEAFIDGDCLVINRQHKPTGLPQIQIVSGNRVQTPPEHAMDENIVDGVKLDKNGKHLGFWVYQGTDHILNDSYVYVPAHGPRSGRHTAWLVYGPNKREDDVRGMPGLGMAIQPLNEIQKNRDSAQLKSSINAMIIGFIKRAQEAKMIPHIGNGAVRKDSVTDDTTGETRPVEVSRILPGVWFGSLQPGEEPVPYSVHGTDVNFASFESAIVAGLSWAMEIPPEILLLSFNSNYSASQAALREFIMVLDEKRARFASQHCQNLIEEWFISELLLGKIEAPGFLEALSDPMQYDVKQAWLSIDWIGSIKPSVDILKEVNAHKAMVSEGWETNSHASRALTGSKFDKTIRKLEKENRMKVKAMRPILEAQREFGEKNVTDAMKALGMGVFDPTDMVEEEAAA